MSLKSLINIGTKLFRSSCTVKTAAKVGAAVVGTAAVGVSGLAVSNMNFSDYSIKDHMDTFSATGENGRSREQVYQLIEEICVKYNIKMEDAKNAMLLETIAGCTTEELLTKSPEELESIIRAFDNALPWKIFSWGDKDIDFVKDIAIKANKKFIASQTGGDWLSATIRDLKHLVGKETNVSNVLKDNGYDITPDGIKAYFRSKMAPVVATGDKEKIKEAYDERLKEFGELLEDSNDPYEKELLTAAITELRSPDRARAAILSVASCNNNIELKQATSRGLSKHFEEISCTADAFGEYTSEDDNTTISHTSFANMSAEDSMIALGRMNSRRQELEDKIAKGEELTEAESRYYNNAQLSQYAGAMTGASCNSYIEDPSQILSTIDRDTASFGIQQEVYSRAASYVESHQNELPITPAQFTATVDKATGNNYTKVLNDIANGIPEVRRTNQKESNTQQKESVEKEINKQEQVSNKVISEETSTQQPKQRISTSTGITNPITAERVTTTSTQAPTAEHNTKIKNRTVSTATTKPSVTKKEFSKEKLNHAISKGVEGIIEYQRTYDVSDIQLTQEILNSTVASSSLQDWALEKFKRMDVALKRLTFPGIHNAENLKKAALLMDPKDLEEMNMTSYYTEKTVDRILERQEQYV